MTCPEILQFASLLGCKGLTSSCVSCWCGLLQHRRFMKPALLRFLKTAVLCHDYSRTSQEKRPCTRGCHAAMHYDCRPPCPQACSFGQLPGPRSYTNTDARSAAQRVQAIGASLGLYTYGYGDTTSTTQASESLGASSSPPLMVLLPLPSPHC